MWHEMKKKKLQFNGNDNDVDVDGDDQAKKGAYSDEETIY